VKREDLGVKVATIRAGKWNIKQIVGKKSFRREDGSAERIPRPNVGQRPGLLC